MAKKLLFENVPLNKTIPNFLEILDPISTVQWVLMMSDRKTQEFNGKAYVEVWSDTEAEIVSDKWNNQLWDENTIQVKLIEDNEKTPEKDDDKDFILNTPPYYIYSVIRFQVNAPPKSVVFVNDIPKVEVDEMGNGVVRSLLPGKYNIKVGFGDYLLAEEDVKVNCDEESPRMKVTMDSSVTQAMEAVSSGLESAYSTIEMISVGNDASTKTTKATPIILLSTKTSTTKATTKVNSNLNANASAFTTLSLNKVGFEDSNIKTVGTKAKPTKSKVWLGLALGLIVLITTGVVIVLMQKNNGSSTPTKTPEKTITPPQGMIYVPGGTVIIGRNNTDDEYQKPVHEVVIPEGYFLDKTEVTNEDYYQYVQDTKKSPPKNWNGEKPQNDILQMPVTMVNWPDALAYCQWRGTRKGLVTRLPSEFEWEHAARGEKNYIYPWGNDWLEGYANINNPKGKIQPVGSNPKDISAYGVLDMLGNVREWTLSDFSLYEGSKAEAEPNTKTARGMAFSDPKIIIAMQGKVEIKIESSNTYRSFFGPYEKDLDRTGFRCLCEIPKK